MDDTPAKSATTSLFGMFSGNDKKDSGKVQRNVPVKKVSRGITTKKSPAPKVTPQKVKATAPRGVPKLVRFSQLVIFIVKIIS